MTSAAMRRSWKARRPLTALLSGWIDKRMEDADTELARILAGPAADLHGHEGLVHRHLELGHLCRSHLIRLERDPPQQLFGRRELELIDHGVTQCDRHLLALIEQAARLVES